MIKKGFWNIDRALMVYYFIFGGIFFITSYYNLDILRVGVFTFGIFVLSMFVKYNMNFNIKNIRKVWKKDKRQFKMRRLSHRDLRKDYINSLYDSILMLYCINILGFILLISYYEFTYVWFLYFLFLIYSIYSYKKMKRCIYLND